MYSWESEMVKSKQKNILTCVCVCVWILEHIKTNYPYTRSNTKLKTKQTEVFLSISIFKTTQAKLDPSKLNSIRVLDAILTRELLNQHVLAPKQALNPLLKLNTY